METRADILLNAADKFLSLAQATTSLQPGELRQALVKSGVLGITEDTFDVNSPAANIIFNLMEKAGYRGKLTLSVKYGAKGDVDLLVVSGDPKLSLAVKNAFLAKVAAVCKRLPPPVETITLSNLVQAANA